MTPHELLLDHLRSLMSAEEQMVDALPAMAKAAASPELEAAFTAHLAETRHHVVRLTEAFVALDAVPSATLAKGMQGLVSEGREQIERDAGPLLGDLALTGVAQRVEHYEIAGYAAVVSLAKALRYADVTTLLMQNLTEERKASDLLSKLAKPMLHQAAALRASHDA